MSRITLDDGLAKAIICRFKSDPGRRKAWTPKNAAPVMQAVVGRELAPPQVRTLLTELTRRGYLRRFDEPGRTHYNLAERAAVV